MNASKYKKNTLKLLKISAFKFQRKKWMPFKLFEILEQFMMGAFVITLTQLERTGSTAKVFIPLEI